MFQKLYKLLEHIDDNTRKQSEELNGTTRVIKELEMQIQARNQLDASRTPVPSTGSTKVNSLYLGISCLGVIALLLSCYFSFHLAHSMQKMVRQADEASALQTYCDTRYKELNAQLISTTEQVAGLDSIIRRQDLAIYELKKLNETAVRTFVYIRKDLERRKDQDTVIQSPRETVNTDLRPPVSPAQPGGERR